MLRNLFTGACRTKHRDTQVDLTVSQMKKKMASYHRRYGLHGVVDTICLVITDIRHQGRAQSSTIISALQSDDPLRRLLRIGEDGFPHRIETLREAIHDGELEGILAPAATMRSRPISYRFESCLPGARKSFLR